jgi:hypothetical protein
VTTSLHRGPRTLRTSLYLCLPSTQEPVERARLKPDTRMRPSQAHRKRTLQTTHRDIPVPRIKEGAIVTTRTSTSGVLWPGLRIVREWFVVNECSDIALSEVTKVVDESAASQSAASSRSRLGAFRPVLWFFPAIFSFKGARCRHPS